MYLSAINVLYSALPEQEVHVSVGLERSDELRLVQPFGIVGFRTQIRGSQVSDNSRIHAREVQRTPRKVLTVERDHGRDVGRRAVWTLAHAAHCVGYVVGIFHLKRIDVSIHIIDNYLDRER